MSKYDVAVSYASSEQHYVHRIVKYLKNNEIKVFYAPQEQERLIMKDLFIELTNIYNNECKYIVLFVSDEYLKRDLTRQEASIALKRQKTQNCIIPVIFNGAKLEGLDPDLLYLDASKYTEVDVAEIIIKKIKSVSYEIHDNEEKNENRNQQTNNFNFFGNVSNITTVGTINGDINNTIKK